MRPRRPQASRAQISGDISDETRAYGRAAGILTGALASAGALAYLFFAVASHSLTSEDYGQVVVLWSVSFLVISILFRPVEQLLARTVAELEESGHSVQHAARVAATIQLAVAIVFAATAIALRSPIEDQLFQSQSLFFWALLGAILAFSVSYYARGFFAGSRRMGSYAALLLVEGSVRLSLALLVAIGLATGPDLMAIAIAVAPAASLVVVPFAIIRTAKPGLQPGESPISAEGAPEFTLAQGTGFAAAVLLIMLSEQILLNSGVLFVRATEGSAAAGFIFNVLMVARAPVVLFQAVAASLLPHLTRLRSRGDETSEEAFALSIRLTTLVIAGFAVAVVVGILAIGPAVMQIAFGENFEYDRTGLVIVAVGMGFYLTAATLSQAVLAQGQAGRAAVCWISAAAVFATINLLPILDAFRGVEVGLSVSALTLCVGLSYLYRNPHPRVGGEIEPGSARELEVRLAAADEVA